MNLAQMKPSKHELLSALADGELCPSEADALFADGLEPAVQSDLRAKWGIYHLVGESLRAPAGRVALADADFLLKLNQRLALEPAHAGKPQMPEPAPVGSLPPTQVQVRQAAANDSLFRWKLLAGFASLAAVFAVGWSAVASVGSVSPAPQMATLPPATVASQPVLVASPQGPVVRDARLEELLAAHKQAGGMSAFQVPSGFLRNATFEARQEAGR